MTQSMMIIEKSGHCVSWYYLDAGATGSMTSGMNHDKIKPAIDICQAGGIWASTATYAGSKYRSITRSGNARRPCKAAVPEGGVTASGYSRDTEGRCLRIRSARSET